ncbi:hypothetical protein SAMN02745133_01567 [Desulforamulus putei DSM 12395]|uniref:Uncharacterized protein n=1 Tax=Desulforamulus putei DSM 12395 TaxID=1121429 RepID=A0A1M4XYB6_9FIRM|nr:hypothetical protein SAMN02745133_01567 [Desulforamulus putei DSM 12395]
MLSEPGDGASPAKETAGPPRSASRNNSKLCRFFTVTEVRVGCRRHVPAANEGGTTDTKTPSLYGTEFFALGSPPKEIPNQKAES